MPPTARHQADNIIELDSGRCLGFSRYGHVEGPSIFYFHGGLSSRLDIYFAKTICEALDIDFIAVDRPGIGLSDDLPHRTLMGWANDVRVLADHLRIEYFALLGWSGGGPYVLACAQELAHRVRAAATVGCMAPINRPHAVQELGMQADRLLFPLARHAPLIARILIKLSSLQSESSMRDTLLRSVTSPADRLVIDKMSANEIAGPFKEAVRSGTRGTIEDYRILGGEWGLDWKNITLPISFWQGEEDTFVPPSHAHELTKRLPNAQLKLLPGCGHFLLHSHAEQILAELKSQII